MATAQKQRQNQAITLKGSVALVTEFFEYSVNSYVGRPPLATDAQDPVPARRVPFRRVPVSYPLCVCVS